MQLPESKNFEGAAAAVAKPAVKEKSKPAVLTTEQEYSQEEFETTNIYRDEDEGVNLRIPTNHNEALRTESAADSLYSELINAKAPLDMYADQERRVGA